ncbi:DNA-binding response regulator, OmpR family, contains REC and winged-helix (wHTH) domain [Sporobacter termitidis DSM 10068]|uniref:Stage 0 sporulation protein A homolog n=1 Tax=Sporobacter termitidis DSM 10068 TaxID=1123282 RepID=A0A1M5WF40_9FIRM|nr:response regulator transcription factor [Sporobacter termitidis]SHH86047.1 DNA-binding response regulator, OmpR family, contains REC and winged-helix (wHTH) domain [Sporobacter termitidis DSM 10068]
MYKVLIVEDDRIIAEAIRKHLESWGLRALCVTDFRDVPAQFADFSPHLVLMDIGLPFYNGYHWCREIRRVSKVPIIFISSASENMNIVMAMDMGGDDFIAKPFDLSVLMAKVQAMLRRTYDFAGQTGLMEHQGAILNMGDATLTYQGEKIELTKNEYKILQLLMENRGRTVSREAIMARLWENDSFVDENALTVNMARLRRKLESYGLGDFIATKKGLGYMLG